MNCKVDACTGDIVMLEQNVYEMFSIASMSATGSPCGAKIVAGRIVKESYGAAKQQHTYTVLWSKWVKPLHPLHPLLIKGRNLYRLKTMRQDFESDLLDLGLEIGTHEKDIELLQNQRKAIEHQLSELEGSRFQKPSSGTYGSTRKDEITSKIESRTHSAADFVIVLVRVTSALSDEDCFGLTGHIVGVVALLGIAQNLKLSRNQRTFCPKKSAPSGSKGAQLRQHIDAALGSGNLREAVRLPPGEDINELLAVNTVDFFNQVNILYGTLAEI